MLRAIYSKRFDRDMRRIVKRRKDTEKLKIVMDETKNEIKHYLEKK